MLAGFRASGKQRSVTTDSPNTLMPAWTATITSGTVDMPTTSAPMVRRKRYSARVSRFGPVTPAYTPRWAAKFSRRAISNARRISTGS